MTKREQGEAMAEFHDVGDPDTIGTGRRVERWPGSRPVDWGEVTKLLPGRRVLVSWEGTADALIHDAEDVIDFYVHDWSAEVQALIARREAASGDGAA